VTVGLHREPAEVFVESFNRLNLPGGATAFLYRESIPGAGPPAPQTLLTPAPAAAIARVATLEGVYLWWAPRTWRDVPSTGGIAELSEPMSFREARKQAKAFNRARREHPAMWAIVVATDGRKAVRA
jgi:hypothetical protein